MIGNALFALGIVLTTASQLRLPAVPLGVGEVCLVLWLALASLRLIASGRICNPRAMLQIISFWACFAFAMSVGTCLAFLYRELDLDSMLHDAFAYLLVAAISCLMVATMRADGSLRQTEWFLIALWNIALALQLADFGAGQRIPIKWRSTAPFLRRCRSAWLSRPRDLAASPDRSVACCPSSSVG
jgi:hypothetical protein